jgi:hypothetical protein
VALRQDYGNNLQLTHHEYFASSGLQEAGAESGGREAGEGALRQDAVLTYV